MASLPSPSGVQLTQWVESLDELRVRELPAVTLPPPEGHAVVRVSAAGVNFFDGLMARGKYQIKPKHPFVLGAEFAGEVVAVTPKAAGGRALPRGVAVGARVCGFMAHGAFADLVVVPVTALVPLPAGMTYEEAAGFPMVYTTAYCALVDRGRLQAGETVLVHAASGGVGLAAVQIAKALGARVIGTAGSPEKRQVAKDAGCDLVLDYRTPGSDWVGRVREFTGGRGADCVYDPVGGDVFDLSTKCTAFGGRILVVGFASGRIATIATNRILLKGVSVVGVFMGAHPPSDVARWVAALIALYNDGRIRPVVSATYPLDRIADALRAVESRRSHGKVVLLTRHALPRARI